MHLYRAIVLLAGLVSATVSTENGVGQIAQEQRDAMKDLYTESGPSPNIRAGAATQDTDWDGMRLCLTGMNDNRWGYLRSCAGKNFKIEGHNWSSPQDCYNYCAPILRRAIDEFHKGFYCKRSSAGKSCYMEYV